MKRLESFFFFLFFFSTSTRPSCLPFFLLFRCPKKSSDPRSINRRLKLVVCGGNEHRSPKQHLKLKSTTLALSLSPERKNGSWGERQSGPNCKDGGRKAKIVVLPGLICRVVLATGVGGHQRICAWELTKE
ncbi:hypothetical protein EDD21DRAFT_41274 [Dissophora ornata]|nr:hypothetical protein EDD21DRAFT_41274 [Dissophora ornata]